MRFKGASGRRLHGPVYRDGVNGRTRQNRPIALTANTKTRFTAVGPDICLNIRKIGLHDDIDDRDELLVAVEKRHVRRADLFTKHVEGAVADG